MTHALPEAAALLADDVTRTLGAGHRDHVVRAAENLATYELGDAEKLVEDVQQEFHDTFVDTTWPACPRHGRHPLWYHADGWWWCEKDGAPVYRLGELALPAADP